MKIAIATNDRKTIAKRTGRAKEFAFYSIEEGKIVGITYKKNTHEHHDHDRREGNHRQGNGSGRGLGHGKGHGNGQGHHHHDTHSHDEVVQQLKGVSVFLVRAVGKHMKRDLEQGNINYILVKGEDINHIIADYLANNQLSEVKSSNN